MDNELKIDLLLEGHEDYVGLWYFLEIVAENLNLKKEKLKKKTLEIILCFLKEGYMEAGLLYGKGYFRKKDGNSEEIIVYIEKEWNALDREPNIGDVIWFNLTEKGEEELLVLLMRFFQKHRKVQIE